jgi:hypothetical protein
LTGYPDIPEDGCNSQLKHVGENKGQLRSYLEKKLYIMDNLFFVAEGSGRGIIGNIMRQEGTN